VADPQRIITSPLRLAGGPRLGELTTLLTADVVARHGRRSGDDVSLLVTSLPTDGATQAAVDRDLAREGHDRASLTREEFVERVRITEEDGRERLAADLAALGVEHVTAEPGLDAEAVTRAARTAFVRLFESGSVRREREIIGSCPRCETVVGTADIKVVEVEAEVLTVRLWFSDAHGYVDIETATPELVPGSVALALPTGSEPPGMKVELPLVGEDVPVIIDGSVEVPTLVIPGHDAASLELARRHRFAAIDVLDVDGVVRMPGALDGLSRYAAREAARDLLAAEGALIETRAGFEVAERCEWCSTIVVPRLGRHWFLPFSDLEVAAADAVRHGSFTLAPPAATDELIATAGTAGLWCLGEQVWAGQPLPVSRCLECRQVDVSVEVPTSCRRCMGVLDPATEVMDPRFVAALAPLVAAGYPTSTPAELAAAAERTTLVVGPDDIAEWVLPMAALGLRLADTVPFSRVVLACRAERLNADDPAEPDPSAVVDVVGLVAEHGVAASRLALLAGDPTATTGDQVVRMLADPPVGTTSVAKVAADLHEAVASGSPATAISILTAALAEGVPVASRAAMAQIAAPLVAT
jgi:valyl-tRNA synthetase